MSLKDLYTQAVDSLDTLERIYVLQDITELLS